MKTKRISQFVQDKLKNKEKTFKQNLQIDTYTQTNRSYSHAYKKYGEFVYSF